MTGLSKALVALRRYPQESGNLLLSGSLDAGYVRGTEAVVGGPIH